MKKFLSVLIASFVLVNVVGCKNPISSDPPASLDGSFQGSDGNGAWEYNISGNSLTHKLNSRSHNAGVIVEWVGSKTAKTGKFYVHFDTYSGASNTGYGTYFWHSLSSGYVFIAPANSAPKNTLSDAKTQGAGGYIRFTRL